MPLYNGCDVLLVEYSGDMWLAQVRPPLRSGGTYTYLDTGTGVAKTQLNENQGIAAHLLDGSIEVLR
jgi:hypothetical protein